MRKLWCNKNITDEGIKNLQLNALSCGNNKNITDEGIKNLPLRELYCYNNENITEEGIMNLPLKLINYIAYKKLNIGSNDT